MSMVNTNREYEHICFIALHFAESHESGKLRVQGRVAKSQTAGAGCEIS
jgi:hypothetical protein